MRLLIITLIAALAPFAVSAAATTKIALTFDDLPALTIVRSQAYVDEANDGVLRHLTGRHVPAIGFVNEGKLDSLDRPRQIANLRKWLDAGMSLGNHTFDHEGPNGITATAYIEGIRKGEPVTRGLLAEYGKKLTWFRHPYLETGSPLEEKETINRWLRDHDYKIAPVTIENSDWMFAEPYDDAIERRDVERAHRIKAAYLAYTEKMAVWYAEASEALFGRRISLVFLLHVTRLNADSLGDILSILKRNKFRPTTLEDAMRDPAYAERDDYAGPDGIEWLERWSLGLKKTLPWDKFTDPPAEIEAQYHKVDPDH